MGYRRYSRKKRESNLAESFLILIAMIGLMIYSKTKQLNTTIYVMAALFFTLIVALTIIKAIRKNIIRNRYLNSGISTVDKMSGEEFERFLKAHFEKQGYKVSLTPKSNDYGADLVLYKDNFRMVLQAKRWNEKVGIEAIQQIAAAISYYKANKGIVITNNYFTENAKELAARNYIELWDRNTLKKIMEKSHSDDPENSTFYSESANSNMCPICGGKLVLRTGRNGQFWGCSNFPNCRYTKNI